MMLLLFALAFLAVFYGGICLGVSDCKRRHGIPKGVDPNDFRREQIFFRDFYEENCDEVC